MPNFATNINNVEQMKEINYKEMKFNPFNLIGGEWMLVTAGNEQSGCPTAVIYLRPSRYTKKFVDEESYFTLCVMDAMMNI